MYEQTTAHIVGIGDKRVVFVKVLKGAWGKDLQMHIYNI